LPKAEKLGRDLLATALELAQAGDEDFHVSGAGLDRIDKPCNLAFGLALLLD
jgi:hypothetical protein